MISLLETDTNNVFFDDRRTPGQVENAQAMVQRAFLGMQEFFRQNPQKRVVWGEFQPVHIRHLALIEAFGRLNLKVGGHRTAPNAVNPTHGPSWRMIVEPGEKVTALGVFPGGQSGNPGSPFYDNMVDTWANGGYYELLFLQSPEESPEKIRRRVVFED
jgi:penicillin amidase